MTAPLNVLLSGPGLIGREHARRIAENADCTLAAVVGASGTQDRPLVRVTKQLVRNPFHVDKIFGITTFELG